jgi:acyl-CoA synthetase (AMP-forming)/AMP-acid ligase II
LPLTITAAIEQAAGRWPDREAVVDGNQRVSYAELARLVHAAGRKIAGLGVQPGDAVALWAPNSLKWILACAGSQLAGTAVVPLNTRLKGPEAAYILNRTRARVMLTVGNFLGNDYPKMLGQEDLPHLESTVRLDLDWDALPGGALDAASAPRPDDTADIIFTSGTTGAPKGVIATHRQNIFAADSWATPVGLAEGDRYLLVNPFFHSFGYKAGWLPCFLRGATAISLPSFDVDQLADLTAEEKVTVLAGAPTIFQSLLDRPDVHARTVSLRTAVTGAASVPPVLIEAMRSVLGIANVLTGYGLTEATGVVTMSSASDSAEVAALTAGRPVPGMEVECVNEEHRPVAQGEEGEVRIRGIGVTPGYYEDEAATRETIDADGWLYTGDIGLITREGCLQITDRKKDMYISGGFNCYPAEIERMLAAHPAIAQAAVIGIPDARLGEVGKAFVLLRPGATAEPTDIITWARTSMANYKAPRTVVIVDSLPLNASGKIMKFALRDGKGRNPADDAQNQMKNPHRG